MSATVAQIRTALAASLSALSTATGLRVYDKWPGQITPPCAVIRRQRTDYGTNPLSGDNTSVFAVALFMPSIDVPGAQAALDAYLDPDSATSIQAAVVTDTTLGGVVRWLAVTGVEEEGLAEFGGLQYLSATVPVQITH